MDLSTLKPGERIIEIVHPATKEPVGIRVSLVHIQDESLKKLKRQFQDERYRLESKGKHFKAENVENNLNELNFAVIKSWEWYNPTGTKGDEGFDESKHANWKGEKSPVLNKKNVFDIFETLPWFRDQIGTEMGDDEAFFPH
jgi:hypothetical protein